MATVSEEILQELYKILEGIVGERAVNLFKKRVENRAADNIPQTIFELAGEMERIFGRRGTFATRSFWNRPI